MNKSVARVLSVGNCGFDHRALVELFTQHFGTSVAAAASARDAMSQLANGTFDLVLVNRQFDRDGDSGLELIRQLKSDPRFAATPVMLISNYPEYQEQAVAAGALPGFGKAALRSRDTLDRLRQALEPSAAT